ncbi:beta-glucanase (GH16 family) [Maribacter vaceletii]|uniref:Beta-glucanase (GH16 family) n=1 Tax=Maribacter vaceletii TaxID=1206816 RepID=A0A495ECW7_9FLAO|nr:Ig-like domain-containing protein [Maribacter vaceletii]RKR14469.1 beta-glucanase (GH16 family) [Maribacter vaceletii]
MLKRILPSKNLLLFLTLTSFLISCGGDGSGEPETPMTNTKPIAKDDNLTVEEDSSAGTANQVTVSANDVIGDDGGDNDNYSLLTNASNGTVTEISDGIFEYIPNADYNGVDSFTYTMTDVDGDTDTATVDITVNDVEEVSTGLTAEDFENIDPALPSFVSLDDTTPSTMQWVKFESMSDEFDIWDGDKWFKSVWNYGVPVFMSRSNDNSGVIDGNLWIKATLNESNPDGRWFQTARIHSKAEAGYPMYTEARIKTAHISAYNTFWLNKGEGAGGVNRDEIDIIENNSKPSCTNCTADNFPTQMNSQYFHADENLTPNEIRNKGNFNRSGLSDVNPLKNVNWNEDYHTYGVWWKDSRNIQFYLDGEPAGSVVVGEHLDGTNHPNRVFTRDLEIIFDLWTNEAGWLGGLPPKSDLGDNSINTMKVDWVRTWKLENK